MNLCPPDTKCEKNPDYTYSCFCKDGFTKIGTLETFGFMDQCEPTQSNIMLILLILVVAIGALLLQSFIIFMIFLCRRRKKGSNFKGIPKKQIPDISKDHLEKKTVKKSFVFISREPVEVRSHRTVLEENVHMSVNGVKLKDISEA